METKPFDRSLFIPIFVAVFSVVGIIFVFAALRLGTMRAGIEVPSTETQMKYQYLGTEPAVVTLAPDGTYTQTPVSELPPFPDNSLFPTFTPFVPPLVTLPGSTGAPTHIASATSKPFGVTYDDADSALIYNGNWISQIGVNGAHDNTLHVSSSIGDSVQVDFIGQKIIIVYQAGPSLGVIAIKLDDVDFLLDQTGAVTDLGEWESPILTLSSHTLIITHISGGSVNLDSLVVIDLSTPTASATSST